MKNCSKPSIATQVGRMNLTRYPSSGVLKLYSDVVAVAPGVSVSTYSNTHLDYTHLDKYRKQQLVHNVNGDRSKTAKTKQHANTVILKFNPASLYSKPILFRAFYGNLWLSDVMLNKTVFLQQTRRYAQRA